MLFETYAEGGGRDHVALFFEELDPIAAEKVLEKLASLEVATYNQLVRSEHIKKVEGKVYEVRVRIHGDCFRFLGTVRSNTFFMVHAVKKKQNKLKRKDITLATERIRNIT